jgi:hypothetical protein
MTAAAIATARSSAPICAAGTLPGLQHGGTGRPAVQPCFAVVDEEQERVIARFLIRDQSDVALASLLDRLCDDYHIGEPGSPLVVRDCRLPGHLAQMPPAPEGYSAGL